MTELEQQIEALFEQVKILDHARNEKAVAMRKEIHVLIIKARLSYAEAYALLHRIIRDPFEFAGVMGRVRETIIAVEEGRSSDAFKMIEDHYRSLGLEVE